MPSYVAWIIGIIFAIAATVVAFIMIVPAKKRAGLSKPLQWLHDVLNFKSLLIEHILKALYIFNTALCLIGGFFMLFSVEYPGGPWVGYIGLLFIILGPFIVRLVYEGAMLAVLYFKGITEINEKLVPQPGSRAEEKLELLKKKEEEEAARARFEMEYAQSQAQQQYQQQFQQQYPQQQYQQQQYQQQYPQQFQQQQYPQYPNQNNQDQ